MDSAELVPSPPVKAEVGKRVDGGVERHGVMEGRRGCEVRTEGATDLGY